MRVDVLNLSVAKRFVAAHHYAVTSPPHVLEPLGFNDGDQLAGVSLWGWGVRPRHTIQRLFPLLTTVDYRELNRLCVHDRMPRNTESQFLAQCINWFERFRPQVRVLISWADGMRGKPGYVYQAANWFYAGAIETEFYVTKEDEVVHPRLLITRWGTRREDVTKAAGLTHLRGYQFLYLLPLGNHHQRKELMRTCLSVLSRQYPKMSDCKVWQAGDASRAMRQATSLKGAVRFRNPAPRLPGWEREE